MKRPQMPLALAIALLISLVYSFRAGQGLGETEHTVYILLVGAAVLYGLWWLISSPIDPQMKVSKMPRGVKVGLACFMLTSGLMTIMALLMLPISGVSALRVLLGPMAPFLLIIGAFALVPFVQRRLQ